MYIVNFRRRYSKRYYKRNSKIAVKLYQCKNFSFKKISITICAEEIRKSWPRIVFALLDLRHMKVPGERRFFRFLSHALSTFSLFLHFISRGNGIVMIVYDLRHCLFSSSFCLDFKAALQRFVRMSASLDASSQEWQPQHFAEVASLVLHLDTQQAVCIT